MHNGICSTVGPGVRELQGRRGKGRGIRLWPWSRMTGWRAVHAVMEPANLDGPHASTQGPAARLRRRGGLGGHSAEPVQKWLGHAQLTTTAIYADALDPSDRVGSPEVWPDVVRTNNVAGGQAMRSGWKLEDLCSANRGRSRCVT